MIILIGESGSGKTTILNELEKRGFKKAINHTTRPKRKTDDELNEYKFLSKDEFNKMWDEGKLLQRAEFNSEFYGISTDSLKPDVACVSITDSVKDIKRRVEDLEIKDVDIKTFYIYVPEEERINRMLKRGDSMEAINIRLEIDKEKFTEAKEVADYTIENVNLEIAVNDIIGKI
ncbi:MAG: AAA family ATPase [Clostridia bacterium]|nr:AAA family ATPase [Clostridia bacterium]